MKLLGSWGRSLFVALGRALCRCSSRGSWELIMAVPGVLAAQLCEQCAEASQCPATYNYGQRKQPNGFAQRLRASGGSSRSKPDPLVWLTGGASARPAGIGLTLLAGSARPGPPQQAPAAAAATFVSEPSSKGTSQRCHKKFGDFLLPEALEAFLGTKEACAA